jgi:hypothetical protein
MAPSNYRAVVNLLVSFTNQMRFIRLQYMAIHSDQVKTPYKLCSGRKPDLSRLRTFGCRIDVEPPRLRQPTKSEIDARTGIFLGYAQTSKDQYEEVLGRLLEHPTRGN